MRLHLDPGSKFPSELEKQKEENKTALDKILKWREEQGRKLAASRQEQCADRESDVDTQYD